MAIALIVLIAAGSAYIYYTQVPAPTTIGPTEPEGNISATLSYTDIFLNSACTCTGTANKNLYSSPKASPADVNDLNLLATGLSTTAQTIGILPVYAGTVWLWSDSGITTDYVVPSHSISKSGGLVTQSILIDLDADGNVNVLLKVDLHNRGINKDSAVGVALVARTMDHDMGNNALSNPTDQDSIGTGTKTVTVEWKYGKTATTNLADNTGFSIGRVFITSNETTFESLAKLDRFSITFAGQEFNINRVGTITSNVGAKQWDIDIGVINYRQTFHSLLVGRKAGDPGTFAFTAVFNTFFTVATEAITVTLKSDGTQPDDVLDTQLTDAVILGG